MIPVCAPHFVMPLGTGHLDLGDLELEMMNLLSCKINIENYPMSVGFGWIWYVVIEYSR